MVGCAVGLTREKLTADDGREFFILRNENGAATFQRQKLFSRWITSVDTHTCAIQGEKRNLGDDDEPWIFEAQPCEFVATRFAFCDGSSLVGQDWITLSDDEIFNRLEGWLP
jgi:hypothetical protein